MLAPWLLILALWYAIRASGLVSPALVPAPHLVFTKAVELAGDRLWRDIYISTQRVFIGVTLGVALAVPVGFCLGWYQGLRSFIDPVINFFRALPPIALIPLVIVYFGIGELAKTVILFYAAFFAGVIVMYEGIAQISPIFIKVARTLGASDFEIFRKVIIPLAVPHILTAVRVALGRQIVQDINGMEDELPAYTLAPALERVLQDSLSSGNVALEPGLAERMQQSIADGVQKQAALGQPAVLLVPGPLRPLLARFVRQTVPDLHVLAYNEVPETKRVRLLGAMG